MAPPKKQVSPDESYEVYRYFRDNWRRRDRFLIDPDRTERPERALEEIGSGVWFEEEGAKAIQEWVDAYVTPAGIKRMWTAMRQRKYQLDKQPTLVALDRDVHSRLKDLAVSHNITLSDLVDRLLKEHDTTTQAKVTPAPHDSNGYRAYVVGLILELKDQRGLNYREIAEELNARKLKTLGKKDTWHQTMVGRIYKQQYVI